MHPAYRGTECGYKRDEGFQDPGRKVAATSALTRKAFSYKNTERLERYSVK